MFRSVETVHIRRTTHRQPCSPRVRNHSYRHGPQNINRVSMAKIQPRYVSVPSHFVLLLSSFGFPRASRNLSLEGSEKAIDQPYCLYLYYIPEGEPTRRATRCAVNTLFNGSSTFDSGRDISTSCVPIPKYQSTCHPLLESPVHTNSRLDLLYPLFIALSDEANRHTMSSLSRRSSDTMRVLLRFRGHIPVHYQRDAFDVQSSRTYISRD